MKFFNILKLKMKQYFKAYRINSVLKFVFGRQYSEESGQPWQNNTREGDVYDIKVQLARVSTICDYPIHQSESIDTSLLVIW